MAPREDDTHRNLIGGHVRTCTCPVCTAKRLGRRPIPEEYAQQFRSSTATDQDWQEFIREINDLPKVDDEEGIVEDKPLSKVPGEIGERRKQAIAEEREARMERERQSGTRARPKNPSQDPSSSTPPPMFPPEIRERNLQKHADEIAEYSRRQQPTVAKPPTGQRSVFGFLKGIFRRKP